VRENLELSNRLSDLPAALDELESLLSSEQLPLETIRELRLVAEEVISNIIRYAFKGGEEQRIEVILSCDGQEVRLELRDQGMPFNPLEAPEPDLDAPIETRSEGGLGIHLMRELTDEMSYVRQGGRNVLTLTRRL
jgi:anti-sigma regulatory factor (Ser/Thr protein kinase)